MFYLTPLEKMLFNKNLSGALDPIDENLNFIFAMVVMVFQFN